MNKENRYMVFRAIPGKDMEVGSVITEQQLGEYIDSVELNTTSDNENKSEAKKKLEHLNNHFVKIEEVPDNLLAEPTGEFMGDSSIVPMSQEDIDNAAYEEEQEEETYEE